MGNCFVLPQPEKVKVVNVDGEVLEYEAPIKVLEVLSEFPGYDISDTLPVLRILPLESDLFGRYVYYLVPRPVRSLQKIVDDEKARLAEGGDGGGVVRIKMVITKAELNEMLRTGVVVDKCLAPRDSGAGQGCLDSQNKVRKLALDTIHEVADNNNGQTS